jgi:hypothetical protein
MEVAANMMMMMMMMMMISRKYKNTFFLIFDMWSYDGI